LSKYGQAYYRGKESNYIFGYNNLRFKAFWLRRLQILKNAASSGNLLDLGCAFGFFIKAVENDFKVYGLDISQYAVSRAKKIVSNPETIKSGDINKGIPFVENFDVIVAFDIIEHLSDPLGAFDIVNKALKSKGNFYLELPLSKTLIDRDKGHNYRPLEEWLGLLEQSNFETWFIKTYFTIGLRGIMVPSKHLGNYCSIIAKKT
jgi:SAM-dependent methyltransferase